MTTKTPNPNDPTEHETRKQYIDAMLRDAGWRLGADWLEEVELQGMPNHAQVGFADYVLYGDNGKPLAVIEAKRTSVDPAKGRQQAKLYADLLEKQHGLTAYLDGAVLALDPEFYSDETGLTLEANDPGLLEV